MRCTIHGHQASGWVLAAAGLLTALNAGCNSPYHADRGTAFGAATGAVLGGVLGHATGHDALAGAALGAVAGGVVGNVAGTAMDDIEARNRAQIAAQMGREIRAGAVTVEDVVSMSRAGVDDELIVNHVRGNGMASQLAPQDLIFLKEQQVSARVIQAMQEPPRQVVQPVVVREAPPPMIVERHYYGRPSYYHHHYHRPPPRAGVHVHFRN